MCSSCPKETTRFKDFAADTAHAFTLVEMLAAVAIVTLLVALLFPTFRGTMAKASTAQCAGNLRNISQGMLSYANDHDGTLPDGSIYQGQTQIIWWYLINPYLGDLPLSSSSNPLQCKETIKTAKRDGLSLKWATYGMNGFMGQNLWGESGRPNGPVKMVHIRNPSKKILVGDGDWNTGTYLALLDVAKPDMHSGGRNFLYCDGHVEWWKDSKQLNSSPYKKYGSEDVWSP